MPRRSKLVRSEAIIHFHPCQIFLCKARVDTRYDSALLVSGLAHENQARVVETSTSLRVFFSI